MWAEGGRQAGRRRRLWRFSRAYSAAWLEMFFTRHACRSACLNAPACQPWHHGLGATLAGRRRRLDSAAWHRACRFTAAILLLRAGDALAAAARLIIAVAVISLGACSQGSRAGR